MRLRLQLFVQFLKTIVIEWKLCEDSTCDSSMVRCSSGSARCARAALIVTSIPFTSCSHCESISARSHNVRRHSANVLSTYSLRCIWNFALKNYLNPKRRDVLVSSFNDAAVLCVVCMLDCVISFSVKSLLTFKLLQLIGLITLRQNVENNLKSLYFRSHNVQCIDTC